MSALDYLAQAGQLLAKIRDTQMAAIGAAAQVMANSIAAGRAVYMFGSGHSVIPVMDAFPRYGSYLGLRPLMDPRLMWFNVVGPGGARELLWLERTEGYIQNFLKSYQLDPLDSIIVYSHGGLNAAPVEMALAAKARGLKVIAVTSADNHQRNKPTHSSGHSLASAADVVIDNCCPLEDSLVQVEGVPYKVSASSTLAAVTITMALLAETAAELSTRGHAPQWVFVSPNVAGVAPDHNQQVFVEYASFERALLD